jgi:hypothetical protein
LPPPVFTAVLRHAATTTRMPCPAGFPAGSGTLPVGSGAFLRGSSSGAFLSSSGTSRRAGAPVVDDDSRMALHA